MDQTDTTPAWQPILFAALAGGMGWGIRGQYGHETGAMIAGVLVTLTLALLLVPNAAAQPLARAVALGAVAMGIGGSETYGQTVGLTHDAELVGNWAALRWGMLGLAIKGAIWIGFCGVFFGMGLSGVRYPPKAIALLMLALVGAYFIGVQLINRPFYPDRQILPAIYFSDDWRWEPGADLRPRFEAWGGLLLALVTAFIFASWAHGDRLARNLGLWGVLGGAIGFPLGQSIQAYHAWNRDQFTGGIWESLPPINWWNMMETTFGMTMGAALGLGLWLNRRKIEIVQVPAEDRLSSATELLLLGIHLPLLILVEFFSYRPVDALYDLGLIMVAIPIVGIAGGRWWPWLQILPITLIPIAGKTYRNLVLENEVLSKPMGWLFYIIIPLTISTIAAALLGVRAHKGRLRARQFTIPALLLTGWTYFLLNYAFFRFPWPWQEWTGRTPNAIIFTICILGLTLIALFKWRRASPHL